MSMLFCDLVGFTAASEQPDPEDVRARIRPYHARLRQEIEGYGGTVEKFVGDAVMAVFGAPVAHEDDAERAVRAGLRDPGGDRGAERGRSRARLQVRVGINTGEAVVALGARPERGEGIVTGDVVNTAARIQSAAPVDGVAVGEQTYRATSRVFEYEPLEPVSVKGKAEPLAIWQAMAARARFGTDIIRRIHAARRPRAREAAPDRDFRARGASSDRCSSSRSSASREWGRAGWSPSCSPYIEAKPELITLAAGRCLPYGEGITFWALGEIVKAEAGILESDSAEVAAAKLDAAVSPRRRSASGCCSGLLPLVGVEAASPAGRRGAVHGLAPLPRGAGRGAARACSCSRICTGPTRRCSLSWSTWPSGRRGCRCSSLCTARPELYERHPGWGAGLAQRDHDQPSHRSRIKRRLSSSPTLLDQDRPRRRSSSSACSSGRAVTRSTRRSSCACLRDRGARRRGRQSHGGDPVPESLQALIAARLDTLSPDRKSLLQDAAVLGKVFWVGRPGRDGRP